MKKIKQKIFHSCVNLTLLFLLGWLFKNTDKSPIFINFLLLSCIALITSFQVHMLTKDRWLGIFLSPIITPSILVLALLVQSYDNAEAMDWMHIAITVFLIYTSPIYILSSAFMAL